MQKDEELKIYNDAIDFFGVTSQKIMVIEEMSELTKELCKELRDKGDVEHIADELADVEITLAQIKMIYDIRQTVEEHKDFKLRRLATNMVKLKEQKNNRT
jgi:NTP pyrophosphatase (non-canonical NTP hydrolase)